MAEVFKYPPARHASCGSPSSTQVHPRGFPQLGLEAFHYEPISVTSHSRERSRTCNEPRWGRCKSQRTDPASTSQGVSRSKVWAPSVKSFVSVRTPAHGPRLI